MSKSEIRKKYYEIRNHIAVSERKNAAMAASGHLAGHIVFSKSKHISCYLPYQNEIDTMPLIQAIWQANKICYLPILIEGRSLNFVRYDEGDKLHSNQFSILEPVNTSRRVAPEKLDLVVTPLVAYDLQGHRLGTGGGYYDRTFAFMHGKQNKKPMLIGLAYSQQQVELLPSDPWDITLDGVATEHGVVIVDS